MPIVSHVNNECTTRWRRIRDRRHPDGKTRVEDIRICDGFPMVDLAQSDQNLRTATIYDVGHVTKDLRLCLGMLIIAESLPFKSFRVNFLGVVNWVAGLVIVMLLSGLKSECLLPGATLDQTWWKWTIRFSEVYARYSMVDNFYQNFLTKADNFENIIYPIYPSFWKESTFFLKEVKRIQL